MSNKLLNANNERKTNMRPIRKQELEYLDRLINNKFQEKQSAIRSQCEIEVQKQLEKDFNKFVSTLRLDKLLKDAQQAEKEYQDFKLSKDAKETALNQNAIKRKQALLEKVNQWSDIRDWSISSRADTVDEVLDNLKKACRQELEEKYKNSEKGKFFKYLDNGIEDAKNILYSGLSIEDVWKNLEQVFGHAQIEVRVPKSFTQISK
jgi:hypothetical protein